jgi:hypothetical protein
MVNVFQHTPLSNPLIIRLLKLRGRGPSKVFLAGIVHVHSLRLFRKIHSHFITWDAIVYASRIVFGDGRILSINTNVADALCKISNVLVEGCKYLWIDQVCNDQRNDMEKSRQIPLIKDIFHLDESLMVWLGPLIEDTSRALALLDELYVISVDYKSLSDDEKRANGVSVGRREDPDGMLWRIFFADHGLRGPGSVKSLLLLLRVCPLWRWNTVLGPAANHCDRPPPYRKLFGQRDSQHCQDGRHWDVMERKDGL